MKSETHELFQHHIYGDPFDYFMRVESWRENQRGFGSSGSCAMFHNLGYNSEKLFAAKQLQSFDGWFNVERFDKCHQWNQVRLTGWNWKDNFYEQWNFGTVWSNNLPAFYLQKDFTQWKSASWQSLQQPKVEILLTGRPPNKQGVKLNSSMLCLHAL